MGLSNLELTPQMVPFRSIWSTFAPHGAIGEPDGALDLNQPIAMDISNEEGGDQIGEGGT